jgi:hypothetical protein
MPDRCFFFWNMPDRCFFLKHARSIFNKKSFIRKQARLKRELKRVTYTYGPDGVENSTCTERCLSPSDQQYPTSKTSSSLCEQHRQRAREVAGPHLFFTQGVSAFVEREREHACRSTGYWSAWRRSSRGDRLVLESSMRRSRGGFPLDPGLDRFRRN